MSQEASQNQNLQKSVESLKSNKAVFTTNRNGTVGRDPKDPRARLSEGQRHALSCQLSFLYKLAYNDQPRFKHVGQRCQALNDLANKYRTGYPWKNNQVMVEVATPILTSYAEAISHQLMEIEKVRFGRDIGHLDGTPEK